MGKAAGRLAPGRPDRLASDQVALDELTQEEERGDLTHAPGDPRRPQSEGDRGQVSGPGAVQTGRGQASVKYARLTLGHPRPCGATVRRRSMRSVTDA